VGLTLTYNKYLTGRWLDFPATKYFRDEGIGQYGLGFGRNMGTKIHGPEWPGYYPSDAIRVTSFRLSEFFRDVNGLPLLLVAVCLYTAKRKDRSREDNLLLSSALCLIGVYSLHFYHGIAFGARHYYLALPAVVIMMTRAFTHWMSQGREPESAFAKLALVGLLIHTLVFAYPGLLYHYGNHYRWASAAIRDEVHMKGISDAVVFVKNVNWGWKSAFPLNDYPLEKNSVIFAKDLGEKNRLLMERFPDRKFYCCHLSLEPEKAELTPLLPGTNP